MGQPCGTVAPLYCLRSLAATQRETSHTRIAPASPGGVSASRRSASIRATSALTGTPSSSARAFSMSQNTGSRLIEVLCPAISTERLTGG